MNSCVLRDVVIRLQAHGRKTRFRHLAVPLEIKADHRFETWGGGSTELLVEIVVRKFEVEVLSNRIERELTHQLLVDLAV